MEEVSGGRMHYMFNRVGGLKADLPAGWLGRVEHAVAEVRRRMSDLREHVGGQRDPPRSDPRRGRAHHRDRARVRRLRTHRAGQRRRRRPAPRPALPRVRRSCSPRAAPAGSSPAPRATARPGSQVLLEQTEVSLDLADACLERLRTAAPRTDQRPAAQGAPRARGPPLHRDREPARASTATTWSRAATRRRGGSSCGRRRSTTSRSCPRCCPGQVVGDMVAILGSMFFVVGDIDK